MPGQYIKHLQHFEVIILSPISEMKRTQFYKLGTNYKEMEVLEFESRSL